MPLPDEAGQEADDAVGEDDAALGDVRICVTGESSDLDGSRRLDALAAPSWVMRTRFG